MGDDDLFEENDKLSPTDEFGRNSLIKFVVKEPDKIQGNNGYLAQTTARVNLGQKIISI